MQSLFTCIVYIVELLAGKPVCDGWYLNNQLQAMLDVKKGGILQNWLHRLCVLSNTRLLIYKGSTASTAAAAAAAVAVDTTFTCCLTR